MLQFGAHWSCQGSAEMFRRNRVDDVHRLVSLLVDSCQSFLGEKLLSCDPINLVLAFVKPILEVVLNCRNWMEHLSQVMVESFLELLGKLLFCNFPVTPWIFAFLRHGATLQMNNQLGVVFWMPVTNGGGQVFASLFVQLVADTDRVDDAVSAVKQAKPAI